MDRTEDRSKEPITKLVLDDRRIESIQEFISPEELYQDLIERVRKYHPSDDISMIEKAYRLADNAHQGQVRKSGEPYIIHPLCVAIILADLELDKETIVAGLLHDVVEDTVMTVEQVGEQFGTDVAFLVDGVTKLQHLHLADNSGNKTEAQLEMQAENLRKMFMAMAKDIRVIMIKLADRLHCRWIPYVRRSTPIRSEEFPSNGFWKYPSPERFQASRRNVLYRWIPESSLQYCYLQSVHRGLPSYG